MADKYTKSGLKCQLEGAWGQPDQAPSVTIHGNISSLTRLFPQRLYKHLLRVRVEGRLELASSRGGRGCASRGPRVRTCVQCMGWRRASPMIGEGLFCRRPRARAASRGRLLAAQAEALRLRLFATKAAAAGRRSMQHHLRTCGGGRRDSTTCRPSGRTSWQRAREHNIMTNVAEHIQTIQTLRNTYTNTIKNVYKLYKHLHLGKGI